MEPEETDAQTPAAPETEAPAAAGDSVTDIGLSLLAEGQDFLHSLLRPWNAYQVAIALALLLAAWLLRAAFGPRIRAWMAARQGWPMWRMRILAFIHRRLMGISS